MECDIIQSKIPSTIGPRLSKCLCHVSHKCERPIVENHHFLQINLNHLPFPTWSLQTFEGVGEARPNGSQSFDGDLYLNQTSHVSKGYGTVVVCDGGCCYGNWVNSRRRVVAIEMGAWGERKMFWSQNFSFTKSDHQWLSSTAHETFTREKLKGMFIVTSFCST